MTHADPLLLARIQFAANITFHFLFPALTIALGWFLLFFKLRYNATQEKKWLDLYFFFTKVFALSFALGIVTGVTMSFQFGTNWPGFMMKVGNIAGPLLAYEVLTAFFLEATFLGIMLFGWRRVPGWVHTLATVLVAAGTTASAFWILALNSWMQTPVGFKMVDGKAHAVDWLAILFSPSMPYRITHVLIASGLTAASVIAGLCAYRWLKGEQNNTIKAGIRTATLVAALLVPIQIYVGDQHGLNTLQYQPQKVAAIEGVWDTGKGVPLLLFAQIDEAKGKNEHELKVPKLASFILTHDWNGKVRGLNDFKNNHPPVAPVFWAFRLMVGMGTLMLLVSWAAVFLMRDGRPPPRVLNLLLVPMMFSGWIATEAGWYVTEVGRQPWLVYNLLKTSDAVSQVPAQTVGLSLTLYLILYAVLTVAYFGTLFYMARHPGKVVMDAKERTSP